MSLPPALLQRLAQRGLVQKSKSKDVEPTSIALPAENEEVIAEDYDEMDADEGQQTQEEYQFPSGYDNDTGRKRTEENFWLERMKARMGEGSTSAGYKGCPNKYNIWHKCTLFCVNRWAEGKSEPSREYMRRYKRLRRKYPLPKGWAEIYDPGCGVYYFCSVAESLVSWLPPTHPKSQVTKCAAIYRRQLEEEGGIGGSDGEQHADDDGDEQDGETRHQREIDEIINASMRPRSPPPSLTPHDFPSLQETTISSTGGPRKQKSRDLDRALSRQRGGRGGDRERDRGSYGRDRRHGRGGDKDPADPMDPSSYSDIPRGKWSDGLHVGGAEDRKKSERRNEDTGRDRGGRRDEFSDNDEENERDYH